MKIAVLTSDTHAWLLRGFFHQWEKYGRKQGWDYGQDPLEIEVAGYTNPGFLPEGVPFVSIGKFADYPVNRWSNALIAYLSNLTDDLLVILLEDYWLIRQINRQAIYTAYGYMIDNPDVIRFDLAADRMFNRQAWYNGAVGCLDICEGKNDYSVSFQASIWRRKLLLEVLVAGETPWEAEINGTGRLNKLPYRVVGSYQWPINYMIIMNKGKIDPEGRWMYPARRFKPEDWSELIDAGCLREIGLEAV